MLNYELNVNRICVKIDFLFEKIKVIFELYMELFGLIFYKCLEIKEIKIGFKFKIVKFNFLFCIVFFYYKYVSCRFVSKIMV